MTQLDATIGIAAASVLLLGLVSKRVETMPLSRPLLAMAVGVALGPLGANWLRPGDWGRPEAILTEAARFTLAISVVGIAIRTPIEDFLRLLRPVALLLTLGMALMWAVSAGLSWFTLGVAPLVALTLGAAITPTDPVVASAIVTGPAAEKTLPDRTRATLSLESGANDGLGYLLVFLPLAFLLHDRPWEHFLLDTVMRGVVLASFLGVAVGTAGALALRHADKAGWVETHSLLGFTVALASLAVTGAGLAGSDGILAAFVAGAVFNRIADRGEKFADEKVQEAISKLFNLPVFLVFGAMWPVAAWISLGWAGALLALAVLLLRRPVALAVLWPILGGGLTRADRVFLSWFGPVGVAGIYYALHATEKTGETVIWEATSLVVAASVLAHGITSGPGLRAYARRAG